MVSSSVGCWVVSSVKRFVGFGCDDVDLNICESEVHVILGEGLVCARVGLRSWAGLMRVCLWLQLLLLGLVCRLSRDLAAMSCARKM